MTGCGAGRCNACIGATSRRPDRDGVLQVWHSGTLCLASVTPLTHARAPVLCSSARQTLSPRPPANYTGLTP